MFAGVVMHSKKGFRVKKNRQEKVNFNVKLSNANGIVEIRIQQAKNHFRLLGFEHQDSLVILTNGFRKKDQKVPKSEITLAQKRRKEYLSHE
jgi:phage-related protein